MRSGFFFFFSMAFLFSFTKQLFLFFFISRVSRVLILFILSRVGWIDDGGGRVARLYVLEQLCLHVYAMPRSIA